MAILAVATALSVLLPEAFALPSPWPAYLADLTHVAWGLFLIDVLARWLHSGARLRALRAQWIDVMALLPLELLGGAWIWYPCLRAFVLLRRYSTFFHGVFLRHGFAYIALTTFGLVVAGAFAIQAVEPGMARDFGDALWWSFVTTTTVGYGDMAPSTAGGRLIAVMLMLLGIGFIGLFTGSVATFFVEQVAERKGNGLLDRQLELARQQVNHLETLDEAEFAALLEMLRLLYRTRRRQHGQRRSPRSTPTPTHRRLPLDDPRPPAKRNSLK